MLSFIRCYCNLNYFSAQQNTLQYKHERYKNKQDHQHLLITMTMKLTSTKIPSPLIQTIPSCFEISNERATSLACS